MERSQQANVLTLPKNIIAYCPECEAQHKDIRLVPCQSGEPLKDFICVNCFKFYSEPKARAIAESQGWKYRGEDRVRTKRKHTFVASDGKEFTDGRIFSRYSRSKGVRLKNIKHPL